MRPGHSLFRESDFLQRCDKSWIVPHEVIVGIDIHAQNAPGAGSFLQCDIQGFERAFSVTNEGAGPVPGFQIPIRGGVTSFLIGWLALA